MDAALRLAGVPDDDLAPLRSTLAQVDTFRHSGRLDASPFTGERPPPTSEIPLIVAGLGRSGSSSIFDYPLGVDGVSDRYGRGELACFANGPMSPLRAVRRPAEEVAKAAADSASWSLLGVTPPVADDPGYLKRSLAEVLPTPDGLAQRIALAMRFLEGASIPQRRTTGELEEAVANLFTDTVALNPASERFLLLNNAFKLRNLDPIRLLPQRHIVAVLRDPRDRYVAQRVEKREPFSLQKFCRMVTAAYEGLFAYLEHGDCRSDVTVVRYEEFAFDERVRHDLQ